MRLRARIVFLALTIFCAPALAANSTSELPPRDWLPLAIATGSLVVAVLGSILSIVTLYLTQFRRPKITVRCSPAEIHFWHRPPEMTGFYLPVIFQNRSSAKGFVYKAFLTLKDPNGLHFAMRWTRSWAMDSEKEYTEIGPAKPFAMDGYAAKADILMFEWHDNTVAKITFGPGVYELTLHIWTSERQSPDGFVIETFEVTPTVTEIMRERRRTEDPMTRILSLRGHALFAYSTGTEQVDFTKMPRI